jgi:ornithine cyclodeaminase
MPDDITLFDSVGFAIEDFSTLRLVRDLLGEDARHLDLVPTLDNPKNLFGALMKEAAE